MIEVKVVSAEWCSQCTPFKKTLRQSGIEYTSIDADDVNNAEFIRKHGVRGLPTTLIFEEGLLVKTIAGPKAQEVKDFLCK